MLLFGRIPILDWRCIYGIIYLFGIVYGLLMNNSKYHMIYAYLDDALVLEISNIFGVICTELDVVLNIFYLCSNLIVMELRVGAHL